MKSVSLLLCSLVLIMGCASGPPPLTPQEVYDQCMAKQRAAMDASIAMEKQEAMARFKAEEIDLAMERRAARLARAVDEKRLVRESLDRERQAMEKASTEQAIRDIATTERAVREQAATDRAYRDLAYEERADKERAAKEDAIARHGVNRKPWSTWCEIRRDRVARGVDPDAEAVEYVPSADSGRQPVEEEIRRGRQERFNNCLSGAVLPFHCSY